MQHSISKKFASSFLSLFLSFPFFIFAQEAMPKREFRAVWIAGVMNLDFPTSNRTSVEAQQLEFQAIADQHAKSKLNALIVQVRPSADAFYDSKHEFWSEWLTGKQGQMPKPYYDPLTFMIEETHLRGMEFHAWFNPYRAVADTGKMANLHSNHLVFRKPEWFIDYGKTKLFDPAIPEVREYIAELVVDVVRRYDVDGIHFDDYFYPYPIANQELNDQKSFEKYGKGFASRADWRRNNINLLIEKIYKVIQETKPYVKFGISPFPVWRNKAQDSNGSETTGGLTTYDHLFADTRLWLSKGWIDYIAPQNYFSINSEKVPYKNLTTWWTQNTFGKHLYIGHAVYKLNGKEDSRWTNKSEIIEQIRFNRQQPTILGSAYFSSKYLTTNFEKFQDSLRALVYPYFALVPKMDWKGTKKTSPPQNLQAFSAKNGVLLHWQAPENKQEKGKIVRKIDEKPAYYVIYRFAKEEIVSIESPKNIVAIHRNKDNFFVDKDLKNDTYTYLITSVDRQHNESLASEKIMIDYKDGGTWADFLLTFIRFYNQ
jgi:uncharacterized lipoprotein YddW (UPF0748 family)